MERREGGRATEPVLECANSAKAKLAPVVIDVEGRDVGLPSLGPLSSTDRGGEIPSALVVPTGSDLTRNLSATIALDERADGASAGHQDTSVLGEAQVPHVRPRRHQPRQEFVGLEPPVTPDSMLDLSGDHDRRVDEKVDGSALVSDQEGRAAERPANPAESGDKRSGRARRNGPPGGLGMRELVLGKGKRGLEQLEGEPLIPDSKGPVPNDSSVRFEGRVQGATGAISSEKGKDGIAPRGRGRPQWRF